MCPATGPGAARGARQGLGLPEPRRRTVQPDPALNAGFTAPIVMQLGGGKTEKMMRRYAAVTDTTLRAAAEAVSQGVTSGRGYSGVSSSGRRS
jgi:hypothetical protein